MRQISIELIDGCNFRCIHCYLKMRRHTSFTAMSFVEFCKILDWAKNNQVLFLTITGGEPLLLSDFSQFYIRAINDGFIVSVLSNMSMLPDTSLHALSQYPPHTIEISIYGMSSATYYAMTGNGDAFDQVFANIRRLSDNNIPFILKYVVTSINYKDIPYFVSWAESHHHKYNLTIANLPLKLNNLSYEVDRSFRITHRQLVDLSVTYPSKISILPFGSRATCDLGKLLHFTASGQIQGCPALPETQKKTILNSDWNDLVCDYDIYLTKCIFCPAWECVENKADISEFLYGISLN